jgi:N-acetylmuramoyl-L-alanine amidase
VLLNKLIVVDPGHGGKNPGAVGLTGVWESEVNYDIAIRLNELLLEAGAFTIMTRKGEQDPNLYERAKMANESRADIFVSIHSDAHPKPETRGTTVYAHPNANQTTWALGWYVHNEIVQATGLKSMGLRSANFVVVREPKMPSILVETAYVTNREDEALLKDPEFRQKIAQAIFNGILLYFDNKN